MPATAPVTTAPQQQVSYTNPDGSVNWDSVLGSGISTGLGLYGSSQATGQQIAGEQNAIGTQASTLSNVESQYGTQSQTGNAAISTLGNTLGVGGGPANYSNFYNSPGYQFQVAQGANSIDRTAAANGSLYTPNTLQQISQNTAGLASTTYQNYINNLMSTSQLGASANQGIASSIYNTGANTSQLQVGQGTAGAAGTAAQYSALSGLPYGSILSGASSLFGGSSGSSTGSANNPNSSGVTDTGNSLIYNPTTGGMTTQDQLAGTTNSDGVPYYLDPNSGNNTDYSTGLFGGP